MELTGKVSPEEGEETGSKQIQGLCGSGKEYLLCVSRALGSMPRITVRERETHTHMQRELQQIQFKPNQSEQGGGGCQRLGCNEVDSKRRWVQMMRVTLS